MKTMAISQFKAQALRVIDQLSETNEPIVVTKRGRPLALITPYNANDEAPQPGALSNTLTFEEDILSPLDEEMWDACT
jgi:prevent-host-death family protein